MFESKELKELVGAKIIEAAADVATMRLKAEDGRLFTFLHHQNCCENVSIDDIIGDLKDLEDVILKAEENTSTEDLDPVPPSELMYDYSFTWTFYHFTTAKGTVTVRWFGTSNGYYSEAVDLEITRWKD